MADGPLTNFPNLMGRVELTTGYLLVTSGVTSGSDGPYTNFGNLKVRVDTTTGYLIVALK